MMRGGRSRLPRLMAVNTARIDSAAGDVVFSSTCVTTLERVVAGPLTSGTMPSTPTPVASSTWAAERNTRSSFSAATAPAMPSRRADDERRHQAGLVVRRGRRARRMGIGQDAGIGALDVLLLAQFLEAGQEALVQGAVGLGLALELLLLGLVLAGRAGNHRRLVDQFLELVLLGLGRVELGAHGERDALRLGDEARPDRGQLVADLLDLGMVLARAATTARRILRVSSTSWMRSAASVVLPDTSGMLASSPGLRLALLSAIRRAFPLDAAGPWRPM